MRQSLIVKALKFNANMLLSLSNSFKSIANNASHLDRFTKEEKLILDRNIIYKNKHFGKRCFIIGNGPSLSTQDITPLTNEITFAMNAFWKHPVVKVWQPTYYCFADPLFFEGSGNINDFFEYLNKEINTSKFFIPLNGYKLNREQKLLIDERTYYIAFDAPLNDFTIKNIDICRSIPSVMSVSQMCIELAIYMGCSPIYLLGLDHDWLSHRGNDKHFYNGPVGLEKHEKYNPDLSNASYRYQMESQLKLWIGYENLQKYGQSTGKEIINATDGGFLDVFSRVDYSDILKQLP